MTSKLAVHILFIDPLEKLSLKKDSSLQLALSLQERGYEVYLLFEKDFYFDNSDKPMLKVYSFKGSFLEDGCYLKDFFVLKESWQSLDSSSVLHMRIDPPFDSRYLRYLWMLKALQDSFGVIVLNDPQGVAGHNEKMICYQLQNSAQTYVGSSIDGFLKFFRLLKRDKDFEGLILKPLDLYQGIGVEKIDKDKEEPEVLRIFQEKLVAYSGPVVAQPFLKEVYSGELRSIFFNGKHLGTIIKKPPQGEFLANIARGAKFEKVDLDEKVLKECERMSHEFSQKGVPWIAFDILGDTIQEANLTCPGLLVEVSKAHEKNLAFDLIEELESYLSS